MLHTVVRNFWNLFEESTLLEEIKEASPTPALSVRYKYALA
jgi:hypothetical protein